MNIILRIIVPLTFFCIAWKLGGMLAKLQREFTMCSDHRLCRITYRVGVVLAYVICITVVALCQHQVQRVLFHYFPL